MQVKMSCDYAYKRGINSYIRLDSFVEDTVEVYSEYGRLMKRVCSYEEFKKFMDDLISGKYERFSE